MRENWTYKKLGEVCEVVMGQSPDGDSINEKEGTEFHQGKTCFGDRFLTHSHLYTSKPAKYAEANSVLLCVRAPVGFPNITQRRICIGRGLCSLSCKKEITNMFLYYSLLGKQAYFEKNSTGSTFKAISSKIVSNTMIPIPPLSEQQAIVSELDKINELISLKKAQLSDLDTLAQSIFYDMFGDPIENEKGWEVKKLGEVSVFPSKRVNIADLTPSQYIGVENLRKDKKGVEFSQTLPNADKAIEFITDDILIGNIRPYLRKIWISNINGGASGDVIIVRKNTPSIMPMYLFKVLSTETFFEYDNANTHGAKMPRGDKKMIELFPIPLPPLSLQQDFAKRIELIEQQKALISPTIKDLETLLASRMQYWFD